MVQSVVKWVRVAAGVMVCLHTSVSGVVWRNEVGNVACVPACLNRREIYDKIVIV